MTIITQTMTIESSHYNELVSEVRAYRANVRAARAEGFRAGVKAMLTEAEECYDEWSDNDSDLREFIEALREWPLPEPTP